jgi:hypothetical protein
MTQQAPQKDHTPQGDDAQMSHQGVMTPPATGDSAINKGTPSMRHFPTPVIRPRTPGIQPGNPKKE